VYLIYTVNTIAVFLVLQTKITSKITVCVYIIYVCVLIIIILYTRMHAYISEKCVIYI